MARNSSYSGVGTGSRGQICSTGGKTGLNKNMLESLNKQTKAKGSTAVLIDQMQMGLDAPGKRVIYNADGS